MSASVETNAEKPGAQVLAAAASPAPAFPRQALLHLCSVAGVLVAVAGLPYLDDRLEDWRYLDLIDPTPLLRALTLAQPGQGEQPGAEAPAGPGEGEAPAVAALPGEASEVAGEAMDLPAGATPTEAVALAAALTVSDEALAGQKTWLEHPERLAPFYQALIELAHGRRAKVRIAHWGDSHAAADGIPHALRVMLQRRFGDGGHGFVLAKARTRWYRHFGVERSHSEGWVTRNFLGGGLRDGAYGYGGVASLGRPGEWFQVGTTRKGAGSHVALLQLHLRADGPARLAVSLDGKAQPPVLLVAGQGDVTLDWPVPDGSHRIRWTVATGKPRLYGAVLERGRGLVYDGLGEVGAREARWLQVDQAHLAATLERRRPDLVVLHYGGNSRLDKVARPRYRERFLEVIKRLRGPAPPSSCLVLGVADHGTRKRGRIVSDPDTVRLALWQREVALEAGCAFFDQRAFMGGEGAMGRWVEQGKGWFDYAHFTAKGDAEMGRGIYRALLRGLQGHLRANPTPRRPRS